MFNEFVYFKSILNNCNFLKIFGRISFFQGIDYVKCDRRSALLNRFFEKFYIESVAKVSKDLLNFDLMTNL